MLPKASPNLVPEVRLGITFWLSSLSTSCWSLCRSPLCRRRLRNALCVGLSALCLETRDGMTDVPRTSLGAGTLCPLSGPRFLSCWVCRPKSIALTVCSSSRHRVPFTGSGSCTNKNWGTLLRPPCPFAGGGRGDTVEHQDLSVSSSVI